MSELFVLSVQFGFNVVYLGRQPHPQLLEIVELLIPLLDIVDALFDLVDSILVLRFVCICTFVVEPLRDLSQHGAHLGEHVRVVKSLIYWVQLFLRRVDHCFQLVLQMVGLLSQTVWVVHACFLFKQVSQFFGVQHVIRRHWGIYISVLLLLLFLNSELFFRGFCWSCAICFRVLSWRRNLSFLSWLLWLVLLWFWLLFWFGLFLWFFYWNLNVLSVFLNKYDLIQLDDSVFIESHLDFDVEFLVFGVRLRHFYLLQDGLESLRNGVIIQSDFHWIWFMESDWLSAGQRAVFIEKKWVLLVREGVI